MQELSEIAGAVFRHHHDGDHDQQDGAGTVIFVTVDGGVQGGADTARTDDADHRTFAEIDVEPSNLNGGRGYWPSV